MDDVRQSTRGKRGKNDDGYKKVRNNLSKKYRRHASRFDKLNKENDSQGNEKEKRKLGLKK